MAKAAPKDPVQKLAELGRCRIIHSFYLAGGTAVNILLKHRDSLDLDFFSQPPLKAEKVLDALKKRFHVRVDALEQGTLKVVLDGFPVSFFEYPYPLIESTEFRGLKIASLLDVALMKLIAIMQRGEQKDFIDLHAIINKGKIPLKTILDSLPLKFKGADIQMGQVLKALVFFKDAEQSPPIKSRGVRWEGIKTFFQNEVKGIKS